MDYEKMLDRAFEHMPKMVFETKRFEVPKALVSIEGNKTIVKNFNELCDVLNRDPNHLLKFLGKEMGAAGRRDGSRVIFVGKFGPTVLNRRVEKYTKTYVVCPVCGKPDTKLKRVDRILVMKCLACGATSPVPQL